MKVSIVYHSETGNTEKVANFVAAGVLSVENTEVRCINIRDASQEDEEYINHSAAVIFGVPTCVGNMSWQVKKWLGTNWNVQVGGKLGSAFSTDNSPNGGGAELAVPTPVNRMPFRGMRRHSSGAEFGRPFIHIGPAAVRDKIEEKEILYRSFGARVARKARQLFDGK